MKTFGNNKKLKQELIKKLQHHQDLDAFIQGEWLDTISGKTEDDTFKGCFYGCTMQTTEDPIEKFSEKYNIDLWYCYLTEKIFEGLPRGEYEKFPLQSIEILPVGVDINKIKSLFYYKVLESQLQFCDSDEKVTNSILNCMELFKTPFDLIDKSEAKSVAELAKLAAVAEARLVRSVSWLVSWSAWSAAESAADSARSATRAVKSAVRTAEAASESAEWSEARKEYYVFLKDTLIDCIKETY